MTVGPTEAAALEGVTWIVVAVRTGEGLAPLPAGVHADARFAEGRVAGSGGCNRYTGPYEATAGAIRIGPCASTMMACPPPRMEVEQALYLALDAARAYALAGGRLVLSDAAGVPVVELAAAPADAYVGTWEATGMNNGRQAVVSLEADSSVTLELGGDGSASGNATCNRYRGTYTVDGEAIAFGALGSTRMACPSETLAAQEAAYLAALAAAVTWSAAGDRLELRDASGALQASFARA